MTDSAATILRKARAALQRGEGEEAQRLQGEVEARLEACTSEKARADLSHSLASYCRDVGLVAASESYARQAVEAERKCDRPALLGNHLMFLALLLESQEHFGEALACAEEAVPCYVRANGADHSETRYILSHRDKLAGRLRSSEEH